MALDLSDLDAFESAYKPKTKEVRKGPPKFDDLDDFEARYAAEQLEKEAAKAAEIAAAQKLVATPPEGPISTPYAPLGAAGLFSGMAKQTAISQARDAVPADTLGSNPLNVLPQAVGSTAANTAGAAGVLADTALNLPRQLAEAALPEDWYERLYGTKEGVPFSQATMAGADVADALRGSTNDLFPMPAANRQWQAENQAVKQAGGTALDELITGIRNPIGVLQEAAKMGAEFALPAKALGVLGSTALMEGGGTDQSAREFEQQWKEGTVQQSAAYQQLASEIGPEAAKEAIKAKRLQLTAQLQALTGVAAAKVSGKLGGQKIEDFLAGNADEGISALQVPVQAAFEGAEEVPVQIGGNIAAQWTGDPTRAATAGAASAAVQGTLVGGATAGGLSTIQSGSAWANEKLNQFGGTSDGKPKRAQPDHSPMGERGSSNTDTNIDGTIQSDSIDTNKDGTIEPTSIVSNIEELSSSVNPAEGLASIAREEAPVNKKEQEVESRSVLANRASALREAATKNLLDEGSIKARIRDEEELRLTLQEDEKRRASGVLPTPERPFLSEDERTLISARRSELREELEKHRAAVGYGNQLRDVEARLAKMPVEEAPAVAATEAPAQLTFEQALRMATEEDAIRASEDPAYKRLVDSNPSEYGRRRKARAREILNTAAVTPQEPSTPLPATTLPAPVQNAAVAPPSPLPVDVSAAPTGTVRVYHGGVNPEVVGADGVWASTDQKYAEGYASKAGDGRVLYTDIPASDPRVAADPTYGTLPPTNFTLSAAESANLRPLGKSATPAVKTKPAPKPRDFRVQATTELQAKAQTDPAYRARVTSNPTLIQTDILARAKELQDADVAAKAAAKIANTPAATVTAPVLPSTPSVTRDNAPTTDLVSNGLGGKVNNARAAMLSVGDGTVPQTTSETRRVANELKNSPNIQDTKVVVVSAADALTDNNPLQNKRADGSVTARTGTYDRANDTIYIHENANAETAVHETTHAATVKAIAAVEQGVVTEPEAQLALENLKTAVTQLGTLTEADFPGVDAEIIQRIKYAARNPQEAVAVIRSHPGVAQALRDSKVMVDVKVDKLSKRAIKMPWWKAFVNSIASIAGKQVFKTQHRDVVFRTVERMLLSDSVVKSSKTLENTDVRNVKMADVKAGDIASRQTGTDAANKVAPAKTDNAPTTIKQDSLVEQRERGGKGVFGRIADKLITLATPRGRGSMTTQLAAEEQAGLEADYRLETELALGDMEAAYKDAVAHLPKATAEVYRPDMLKYMQGDKSVGTKLPTKLRESIDALRTIMDNRTLMMIALGAIPPKQVPKYLNNLGKWTHKDYMKMRMDQESFARMVQDYAYAGKDVIAAVLPEVMADLALPPVENIQQLGERASSKNKDKDSRKSAKAILKKYATQWGIGASTQLDGPDGTVERLKALKLAGEGKLREVAIYYANRIIKPDTTSKDTNISSIVGSNLQIDDSAIDKLRVHMPAYMAKLYGEFKDPAAVAVLSLEQQGRILAKFKALLDYREQGIKDGIIKKDAAGMDAVTMDKQGFTKLEHKDPLHYGPLQGYWIDRKDQWLLEAVAGMEAIEFSMDPARYLAGYLQRNTPESWLGRTGAKMTMGAVTFAQPVGKGFKISQVLLDHTGAIVNAGGSAVFLSGGLTAPMGSGLSAAQAARESSFAGTMFGTNLQKSGTARKAKIAEHVRFLTRATVLQNASLSADLRSDLIDRLDNELDQYLPGTKRAVNKAGRLIRRGVDFAARVNSFGDEFSKVLMWYARIPHLQAIYPDKTEQEIWALAAEEVLQTTANWHRSAPLSRVFSNTGAANAFMVFQTEMLRASYNSLALANRYAAVARKGFGTPEGAAAGKYAQMELAHFMIRITGAAAANKAMLAGATFFAGVAAAAVIAMSGDDDDDKEKKKAEENIKQWEAGSKMNEPKNYVHARELVPSFTLGDVKFFREVEPDVYTFASTQRLEVLPVANIYNAAKRDDWEELNTIASNFMFSETPTWEPLFFTVGGSIKALNPFADEADSAAARKFAAENAGKLLEAVTPGAAKRLWKQYNSPIDLDAVETVLNQTAATVQRLDLRKTAGYNIADYKVAVDKATAALRDDMGDIDGVGEAVVGHGIDYTSAVTTKYNAFVKARRTVLALKGLGKSEDWIRTAIKTNPINDSLSKEEVTSLMTGNFRMPEFGEVLTKKEETMLRAATLSAEKVKVKEVFKQYREDLANQRALFAEFIKREKESL